MSAAWREKMAKAKHSANRLMAESNGENSLWRNGVSQRRNMKII
jgi:hypothetical protein